MWRRCSGDPGSQESLRKPSTLSARGIYSPPRSHTVHISESEVRHFFVFIFFCSALVTYSFSQLYHCSGALLNLIWTLPLSAKVRVPDSNSSCKGCCQPTSSQDRCQKSPPSSLDWAQCLPCGHKAGCDMENLSIRRIVIFA